MTTTSPVKTLELDGESGFVTLAPAQALELYDRDFTVEAWIRIAAWGASDILMVLGGATSSTRQGLHLCVKSRLPHLGFYNCGTPGQTELALGTWYHLAWRYTKEGGEQAIFVNGVLDASAPDKESYLGTETLQIGRFADSHYFHGEIAELRIWRTARTEAEILDRMHRRLTGDEAGLVGVWPLADGEGETAANAKAALPGRAPYGLEGRPLSALEVHSPYGEEAVGLAGDGSWIEIPHAPDLHFTAPDQDFTIELHLLAACDQGAGESERVVLEKWGGGGGFPYSLRYRPADGTFVFARSSGATPHPEIVTGGSFGDGCFHHLAAAKEGTTLRLYVDGELEGTTTDTVTSTIRGTSPLYLGGRARKSHFLKGVFCELRVWRRARSETEIRDAMESRLSGDEHDLAGYWPLDAADVAAEDLSIHCGLVRPQGTLTSTAAWADAVELPMLAPEDEGAVAPALEFDGARSAVTVAASEALAVTSALTVEAWVQPAAGGGSAFLSPVVSRCDATSGWELCANDQEFAFAVTVGGTRRQVSWSPPAAAGRWMHLAGVFDGTRLQLHVNGRAVPTAGLDASGEITAPGGVLCLGRSAFWSGRRFRGRLAEVRVWNVARSAVEIGTHLYRRLAGDEQGLAGYWPLSEGTGETVAHPGDETLPGTVVDAAWAAAELPPRLPAGEVAVADPAALAAELEARVVAQAEELRKAVQRQKYREKRIAELSDQLAAVDDDWARERAALKASLEGEIADRQEQLNAIDAAQRDTDSEVVDALLDDVVKDTHEQIESARRELVDQGSEYQLGPVSVEVKYVAGAAGRGALFPGAETEVEGERVTRLQLNLGAGKVPEPAAAVPAPVPAVVGLTELMARSNLNAAGFLAEVHGQVVTADDQVGKVVSQLPAALTEAEPNSAVRVFLGKAG